MAPRGRYERRLSPAERWAAHRAALIRATAEAMSAHDPSAWNVDWVVRRAQKGKNTFYEHFRSMEQATRAVESSASSLIGAHVESRLREAVTPRERLRASIAAWLDANDADPTLFRALLAAEDRVTVLAWENLSRVLSDARGAGLLSATIDEARMSAAVGAFLALLRANAEGRLPRPEVDRALEDVLLRLFR
jgi:AcrR family transcriptional regulator